jgi:hypothetical protein
MTVKVSEDGNTVCCGRNGPRLAFQEGGLCEDCRVFRNRRLCPLLPCWDFVGEKCVRYGNYQEVKS